MNYRDAGQGAKPDDGDRLQRHSTITPNDTIPAPRLLDSEPPLSEPPPEAMYSEPPPEALHSEPPPEATSWTTLPYIGTWRIEHSDDGRNETPANANGPDGV